MLVAKFVYDNYIYDNISFFKFGIPIKKDMLVLPINEDVYLDNIVFLSKKAIILEILEEDILSCERNAQFKVRGGVPIRDINSEELSILRTASCKLFNCAYNFSNYVDNGPTDLTRTAACKDSWKAYLYAKNIEQKPTDETRTAACKNSEYAYMYARDIDKKPTEETRTAACMAPCYAYYYAMYIDRKPTDETRTAACWNVNYAYEYAIGIDKKPTDETRSAACQDPLIENKYKQWEKELSEFIKKQKFK
jgi:hypothetical protein